MVAIFWICNFAFVALNSDTFPIAQVMMDLEVYIGGTKY